MGISIQRNLHPREGNPDTAYLDDTVPIALVFLVGGDCCILANLGYAPIRPRSVVPWIPRTDVLYSCRSGGPSEPPSWTGEGFWGDKPKPTKGLERNAKE